MVNQITDPPNKYEFGLSFNYQVWTQGTVVSLVNVPWNNDYRDIVRFASKSALDTYINSRESDGIRIEHLSYIKPNQPVRVNKPINAVINYNYLRASNPLQPVPGGDKAKNYYYFINDVRYLSPNATELVLQLDVWQTFGYDVKFGSAFVERGHIGIANENQFDNYGRDYLSVPEGFDLGGEYRVIAKRSEDIMGLKQVGSSFQTQTDVVVVSTVDLLANPGDVNNPVLVSAGGSFLEFGATGAAMYVWDSVEGFLSFLDSMADKPWVTQGIISATLMPKVSRYNSGFAYVPNAPTGMGSYVPKPRKNSYFTNWRNSSEILNAIPTKYRHLKKFLTFPYMGIQLTCYTGNTTVLKPEAWNDPNALIMERISYTPPGRRVEFTPRKYNSDGRTPENFGGLSNTIVAGVPEWQQTGDDYGDYLDVTVGITNFPTMPIVNNGQLGYLAANNSTLNFQRQSAGWAEEKNLRSAQTGYDQASSGMNLAESLTDIGITADRSQTGNVNRTMVAQQVVSAAGGVVGGAVGGAIVGGAAGAAIGAATSALSSGSSLINAGIQTQSNDEALAIRNLAANQSVSAANDNRGFIRDTNKNLADWAARGDYANEIAGINARVRDAQMIQPTVSGQFGGESINLANGTVEVALRWKMIDKATIKRVGDFWLRFGYAVNMFVETIPEDMMVMSKFTYWKMTQTYLLSSPMPETIKQTIRGIFEKGVTVYRNPADIGTVDIGDNEALEGISY